MHEKKKEQKLHKLRVYKIKIKMKIIKMVNN